MRNSILGRLLSCLAFLGAAVPAAAAEAPRIESANAHAPGLISIAFSHSGGTGQELIGFTIEELIGDHPGKVFPVDHPGSKDLLELKPNTDYKFSVCALYLETGEKECAETGIIRTPQAEEPKSSNFPPPAITNHATTTSSITVFWGATGSYPIIIARLTDARGHQVAQVDIKNIPNRSHTFQSLYDEFDYVVMLKGCDNTGVGASRCGPWSNPPRSIRTRGSQDCPRYVQNAMAAVGENKRLSCRYTGDQWSDNPNDHSNWCNGLADADLDAIGWETAAREQAIQACIKNNEKKQLACLPYWRKATAAVQTNTRRNCGFTGDRWSTDPDHHMNWCVGLAPADRHYMASETAAREQAIKNCTGIMQPKPPGNVQGKPDGIEPANPDLDVIKKPSGIKKAPRPGAVLGR